MLATSDVHVNLRSYDYFADRPTTSGGLARIATLVRQQRRDADNSILVDNGDFLQGSLLGDYIAYERDKNDPAPHPAIAAMNRMSYDAVGLGNHEFNFGLDFLSKSLADARFPVLCSNVFSPPEAARHRTFEQTLMPPFTILTRDICCEGGSIEPLRIGIFSVLPTQMMIWDRRHVLGHVETHDIVETARTLVPKIRAEGADIVIALCHSGLGDADYRRNMEHAALPLAAVSGIDAMVCGHSHLQFPGPDHASSEHVNPNNGTICGTPAVMPGFGGNVLGQIDLNLLREGGIWRVKSHESQLLPTAVRGADHAPQALVEEDTEILACTEEAHKQTLTYLRRPVGAITRPVHSYFSLLGTDASVQMVTEAQKHHLAQLTKGTQWEGLPVLSAAAPFKTGGRGGPENYTYLPSGTLALGNLADLYVFPNMFRAVQVNGAQLAGWLERAAGVFQTITQSREDQMLLDPDFPSYNFDVIDGVTYQIDITRPPRFNERGRTANAGSERILNLCYNGAPVRANDKFLIATNSFRAGGGGDFPGAEGDTVVIRSDQTSRQIVLDYIQSGLVNDLQHREIWSFAPAGGAQLLFDTSPQARDHMEEIAQFSPEDLGDLENGFARLRLTL
ncbi:bifunctional 2',3'-cyclic-nucleotide 2'-phosphodiesterase/3'-nucleotidase [Litorivita sp. NS0012-18]